MLSNEIGIVNGYAFTNSKSLKSCGAVLTKIHLRVVSNNDPNDPELVAVYSDQPDKDQNTLRFLWDRPNLILLLDVWHGVRDLSSVASAKHVCYRPFVRELSEAYLRRLLEDVTRVVGGMHLEDDTDRELKSLPLVTPAEKDAREQRFKRMIQAQKSRFQHSVRRGTHAFVLHIRIT
jgi:hypothetical protein